MDIENTEALLQKNFIGQNVCKISLLSGVVGDGYVKLYDKSDPNYLNNILACSYLGLSFEADSKNIFMWVTSTNRNFSLSKNDELRIKFDDGNYMACSFPVGKHFTGKENRNLVVLSNIEVVRLLEYAICEVIVLSSRKNISVKYVFSEKGNFQYSNETEGAKLISVALKRIVGCKLLIPNSA